MLKLLKKSSTSGYSFSDDAGAQDGAHIVRVTPGNVCIGNHDVGSPDISPLGDERADIRAAQIVSAVYGAQGVKVPLNEAILQWEVVPANNIKDPFTAFENALFAATQ